MYSILKGCLIAIIICLVGAYAQDTVINNTPFVVSANEVPVLGGRLDIFGQNFGSDPSEISVYIHHSDNAIIPCVDVKIIAPNTAISCSIVDVGTGSMKHIEVVVDGVSNDDSSDANVAFRRSAPMVDRLAYDDDKSVIRLHGHHFGFNAALVNVELNGVAHRVVDVNDSVITCKKHGSYYVYSGDMAVYVEVDSQNASASVPVMLESVDDNVIGTNLVDAGQQDVYIAPQIAKFRTILLAAIPVAAGIALLAGFLVMKRRKLLAAQSARSDISTVESATKGDNAAIVVVPTPGNMVRDSSMEEIDLNADVTHTATATQPDDEIYELQRSDSSSSFSSFSSTYSSTNCTPSSYTPDTPSSPRLDASDFPQSTTNDSNSNDNNTTSKRSLRRDRLMTSVAELLEPISRLGKRSMDSPYFAKQNAFDSPLASQDVTPSVTPSVTPHSSQRVSQSGFDSPQSYNSRECTPTSNSGSNSLHTSQEINQLHKNPFDSACVLHSAIQRAAILRSQQKQQKKQAQKQVAQPILQGRRASLGAAHPQHAGGRRSSLSTVSLHVSALHNSTGITKYSERQQQPKQQRPLRATQYIHQIDEETVEGDE